MFSKVSDKVGKLIICPATIFVLKYCGFSLTIACSNCFDTKKPFLEANNNINPVVGCESYFT